MDLIQEHNKKYDFFHDITGEAMRVHRKYHPGLLESAYEAAVTAALATLGTAAVSGWELPTKSQMQLVEAKLLSDDASLSGAFYLFRKSDNGIGYHKLGGTSWATVPNTTTAYRLRPVAVVTVAKE